LTVEIGEVPSQRIRSELLALLKSWFPGIDSIRAENRLKTGRTLLRRGVDESSGRRLLDALKTLKVEGRLITPEEAETWLARLWNPGLVVSGIGLALAPLVGGWTAAVLLLAALAAPVAGAYLKKSGAGEPLIDLPPDADAGYWSDISKEYSEVLRGLTDQDRTVMKSLFRTVFDLQGRLRSGSLPSIAAGSEHGELQGRLNEVLRSALQSGRRMSTAAEEPSDAARQDLSLLREVIGKTYDWFRALETGAAKSAGEMESELNEVSRNIDRIVQEARSPYSNLVFSNEKTSA